MGYCARILVVDDDESIRKILTMILEDSGYIVDAAKNGKEAIRKSHVRFYNVALIDIRLPDIDGVQLLTRLKPTVPRTRKIVITGYPSQQNAIEALNRGADAYVMKPFNMGKVLMIIREQLKRQEEEMRYSQEKVTEFIETRVKQLEEGKKVIRPKVH
jgi:DNA-binding response OmpR family regulator